MKYFNLNPSCLQHFLKICSTFALLILSSVFTLQAAALSESEKNMLLDQFVEIPSSVIKAENFSGKMLDGKVHNLSDFKGKWVFLNFWATWCTPCLREMPDMEALHQKFGKQGFVILAVGMGESIKKSKAFLKRHKFTFAMMADPEGSISQLYGVSSIPVTFLITPEGEIVARAIGPRTWANKIFMKFFNKKLSSKKP